MTVTIHSLWSSHAPDKHFQIVWYSFWQWCEEGNNNNNRMNIYSSNIGMLYLLLKNKNMPHKVQITIYKTKLWPFDLYEYKCWALTVPAKSHVQAAEVCSFTWLKVSGPSQEKMDSELHRSWRAIRVPYTRHQWCKAVYGQTGYNTYLDLGKMSGMKWISEITHFLI